MTKATVAQTSTVQIGIGHPMFRAYTGVMVDVVSPVLFLAVLCKD